jgi:hypothetical protein
MLISTNAFFLSFKNKIVFNSLTMCPISILTVDLNSLKRKKEKKKGRTDRQRDRQMDGLNLN